jgi:hypothetical protein
MRASSVRGGMMRTRAAASSIASGRPVEQTHQRIDRTLVVGSGLEVAACRARALAEQGRRIERLERRDRHRLLAGQAEHLARGQDEARLARLDRARRRRSRRQRGDLLEVVEDQQARAAPVDRGAELGDRVVAAERNVEAVRDRVDDAVETARLRQVAEPDAAGIVAEPAPAVALRQPRLAGPPMPSSETIRAPASKRRAKSRNAASRPMNGSRSAGRLWRTSASGSHSPGGGRRDRPCRCRAAARGSGLRRSPRTARSALEAFQAPVAMVCRRQLGRAERRLRIGRQQGLAALRQRHHAGRGRLREAVDLERLGAMRDVVGRVRAGRHRADVQAGARQQRHAQAGERALVAERVLERIGRGREQQQEAVALVDLAAAAAAQQIARDAVVRAPQRRGGGVAEPLGQRGAAHDIRLQQREDFAHDKGGTSGAADRAEARSL